MASVISPSDIITEILSRLPVKPLLRFRCVSKPWCSLIDSEQFVKKHLKQSVATQTNLNLILGFQSSISSISLDSLYPTGIVSADNVEGLAPPPFSGSIMLNSCNGLSLVLINKAPVSQLLIWNPFTRKYKEIPVTPVVCPVIPVLCHPTLEPITNCLTVNEKYAFAYVSVTDEYKIVRVREFSRFDGTWLGSWMGSEAKMFSSTSNVWEEIQDFPYRISYNRVWGAHLNGVLHTLVNNGSSDWSIMGFDVISKQHATVPKLDLGVSTRFRLTVDVLGGGLSLINQDLHDPKVDVWVMREYGVKDSWVKLVSVALQPPRFSCGSFSYTRTLQPIAYSKDGEEVLLNVIDNRLYWYNLRTGTEREVTLNIASQFYTDLCFETFASVPGFISVGHVEGDLKKDCKEKRLKENRGFFLEKDFRVAETCYFHAKNG